MTTFAKIFGPRLMLVGGGSVKRTSEALSSLNIKKPLIVTDPFMVSSGMLRSLTEPLAAAGVPHGVFSETVPDPTAEVVVAGTEEFKRGGYDGLIGFGGGSPMDTAKAMNVLAKHGGSISDYRFPYSVDDGACPLVCIPTTAGTGSECTRVTVIGDPNYGKMMLKCPALQPEAAIVDYELTLNKPFRLTADTGIDAFTHALEAYVSKVASPYSDSMATAAIARIGRSLKTACFDPSNAAAREDMLLGSTLAGIAFSNASVALVHGMSRPMGAHFHIPHGLSNAMLLPSVTQYSLSAALERYADVGRMLELVEKGAPDQEAAEALLSWIEANNKELEVPTIREYGAEEAKWNSMMLRMAEECIASGSHANNPRVPETPEEITDLYRKMWI